MRFLLLSDLHLEFASFQAPEVETDAVILAGDIGVGTDGLAWARNAFPAIPILYVAGNHEHYGQEINDSLRCLRSAATDLRIQFLDRDEIEVGGIRVLGCTLWTDFELYGAERMVEAMRASMVLNDYRMIRDGESLITPEKTRALHFRDRAWLEERLARPIQDGKRTLVITHMLPSFSSVSPRFQAVLTSAGFASRLDHLLGNVDVIVHGHTHDSFDYRIGNCRVYCNPRGYPSGKRSENRRFNPRMTFEL